MSRPKMMLQAKAYIANIDCDREFNKKIFYFIDFVFVSCGYSDFVTQTNNSWKIHYMFKKIILASTLAISASFASWDLFPVLENHKGQARLATSFKNYTWHDDVFNALGMYAGVRYTAVPNLELAINVPYRLFTYFAGEDMEVYGFGSPYFSTRYQFIPTMNVFADVYFPVGNESFVEKDAWAFDAGLQFSTRFSSLLNFGSELGAYFETYGENHYAPFRAYVNTELDFTVSSQFAPYILADVDVELGGFEEDDGYEFSNSGGYTCVMLGAGAKYDFNRIFSLDASIGFAKWVNVDDTPVIIRASLAALFNF